MLVRVFIRQVFNNLNNLGFVYWLILMFILPTYQIIKIRKYCYDVTI
jgi:hypothetical protein